jgi:hypothetical protein
VIWWWVVVVESEKKKGRRRMALGDLVLCMQRSVESMTSAFLGSSAGAGATTGQQHLSSLLPQQHMEEKEKQEKEEQEQKQLVMLQEWREQQQQQQDTVASSSVPDFPHNLYLSDLRHNGVAITSAGPVENGVVSKWRMKDRVRDIPLFSHLLISLLCVLLLLLSLH